MTARHVTGSYVFFSAWHIRQFSADLGQFPCSITQKTWREGAKSTGEDSKNPVEKIPEIADFYPLGAGIWEGDATKHFSVGKKGGRQFSE